jgi:hypothetical protein
MEALRTIHELIKLANFPVVKFLCLFSNITYKLISHMYLNNRLWVVDMQYTCIFVVYDNEIVFSPVYCNKLLKNSAILYKRIIKIP